jgi:hypothetical protein
MYNLAPNNLLRLKFYTFIIAHQKDIAPQQHPNIEISHNIINHGLPQQE